MQIQRHGFDFVQKQRAAAGVFDTADAPLAGAGEGAGLVAKQLAFKHAVQQRAAIDGDKRPAPAAGVVNRPRHHLFAHPGFAIEQDIHPTGRQGADQLADALHGWRLADDALYPGGAQPLAQPAVFLLQRVLRQRAPRGADQPLGRKRLFNKILRALAHGLHRHRHIAMAGDQQHRQLAVDLAQFAQQGEAIAAGQAHIADHQRRARALSQRRQHAFGVGKAAHGNIGNRQRLLAAFAHRAVIFDQKHFRGHQHGGRVQSKEACVS